MAFYENYGCSSYWSEGKTRPPNSWPTDTKVSAYLGVDNSALDKCALIARNIELAKSFLGLCIAYNQFHKNENHVSFGVSYILCS